MASMTSFVFIIPVYNCEHKIQQTLLSVLAQSYSNWRILLRDDLSTDKTTNIIQDFIKQHNLSEKIQLTVNKEKHGEVRNTLEAVKGIENHEVICRLDGGDWLTDNDTLAFLDMIYQNHDPACLWTGHRWSYTNNNISGPLASEDADVYEELLDGWCTSHLKTWRKEAMNGINDINFRDENGDYIMIACDRAVYLPILHKAKLEGKKRLFVPICCYHYAIDLSKEDLFTEERSIQQRKSAEFIHSRGYID
jgi:glycosyltransferase involved in cell wall biosynthesis